MCDRTRDDSLRDCFDRCLREAAVSEGSRARMAWTVHRAVAFFEGRGIEQLASICPDDVSAFVTARLASGGTAGVSTQHNRRSVLRTIFRAARRGGLASGDPTADIALTRRSSIRTRPLSDDEVELCRDVAWWTTSRMAACWALAEATARGVELANITTDNIDLDATRVWIGGTTRTAPRWGELTDWGARALRRRLAEVDCGHLVFAGANGTAGQVSTCRAIGVILLRAGLVAEPDVRPASVAGWAGRMMFERTGRIEDAAVAMGVRSLDRAARLIGLPFAQS